MNKQESKAAPSRIILAARQLALTVGLCIFFSAVAIGQDDPEIAPPPLKTMSKDERTRLDSKADPKDRTKLALEFMTIRISSAERFSNAKDYDGMFRELGNFHALMDDALNFLIQKGPVTGKVLDNLKRFEIGLRAFSPRIEIIRRELPIGYDDYVRKLIRYVREARVKATDPMFGETVLPTRRPTS